MAKGVCICYLCHLLACGWAGGLNERAKILTHVTPYSAAVWGRGLGVKKRYNGFPPIFHREAGSGALLSASQAKVTMLTGNLGACEKGLTTGR
jgi:hypothetical protein